MNRHLSAVWVDILLILALGLSPLAFFWPLVAPGMSERYAIPAGDFGDQYYPLRAYVARRLAGGEIPLWNPYLYGGQPALADIQSGALYPPHLLQSLIVMGIEGDFPLKALEWQALYHFSVAAAGVYLLARRLILAGGHTLATARSAASVAAVTFSYSGYLSGFPVQQVSILQSAAWLPWTLWALDRALGSPDPVWGRLAWPALFFALSILAGHPQTAMYVAYAALGYALFRGCLSKEGNGQTKPALSAGLLRGGLIWGGSLGLAVLLAAVQLLPTLEFIGLSSRAELSYEAVAQGLPLPELAAILYPGYFGGSPQYVGILPLALSATALVFSSARRQALFWGALGALALVIALGGNTFLYALLHLALPGFDAVRQQERVLVLFSLSAALLSGFGAAALAERGDSRLFVIRRGYRKAIGLAALALLLATLPWLYGLSKHAQPLFGGVLRQHLFGLVFLGISLPWLWLAPALLRRPLSTTTRNLWLAAGVLVVAANLFVVNGRYNVQQAGDAPPFAPTPQVAWLQEHTAAAVPSWRIASGGLLPGGHSAAAVYELHDITGNTPLHLAHMAALLQSLSSWHAWQLLNVRYVLSDTDLSAPGITSAAEGVFEVGDPFPRAWLVHQLEIIEDEAQALRRLDADDFDLRRAAIIHQPLSLGPSTSLTGEEVRFTCYEAERRELTVEAPREGMLVISEGWHPGWQAWVNGQPVAIQRVNVALMGVPVPAGRYTVELRFEPASYRLSRLLSLGGVMLWLLLVTGGGVYGRRSSRQLPHAP